jgi:hypothetical protein
MSTAYERIKRLAASRRQAREIIVTFRPIDDAPAPEVAPTPDSGPQRGNDEPSREDLRAGLFGGCVTSVPPKMT